MVNSRNTIETEWHTPFLYKNKNINDATKLNTKWSKNLMSCLALIGVKKKIDNYDSLIS